MAPNNSTLLFCIFIIFLASGVKVSVHAKNFTLVNQCKETVWPGIITRGDGYHGGGFELKPGQTASYNVPDGWSGRIWGRTGCSFDKNSNGSCQTGDCGTSMNCTSPGSLPVTIAEFTLGSDVDYYDVSLVDGFNVPVLVVPGNGKGNCSIAGCDGDMRQNCPSELVLKKDGTIVACRSACDVFNTDEYCCRGTYAEPVTCLASNFSKSFKQICPAASSYAFDDRTSIITCSASDYLVAFCASRNQTSCSYRDQKFVCKTSQASNASSRSWWSLMLAVTLTFVLPVLF